MSFPSVRRTMKIHECEDTPKGFPSSQAEYEQMTYRQQIVIQRRCAARLRYHLQKGNIIRPDSCEWCYAKESFSVGRYPGVSQSSITGHHIDYSQPLNVIWICRSCHGDLGFERFNTDNIDDLRGAVIERRIRRVESDIVATIERINCKSQIS